MMTLDPRLVITGHKPAGEPDWTAAGELRLRSWHTWLVTGPAELVEAVHAALPRFCERVGEALLLRFGNAVGSFEGGPLGRVHVESGTWGDGQFEAMLADICARMALLPLTAATLAHWEFEQALTGEQPLYHAFVYLRHILGDAAAPDEQLLPALRLVLTHPHRRFERVACWSPLATVTRVEARGLLGMVTPQAELTRARPGQAAGLAQALRGHLPQRVEETRVQASVDVPENQFVKAFLGQATAIVEAMRAAAQRHKSGHFRARILADCEDLERKLSPVIRHGLWAEVSAMRRIPAESQVLQRRRGYREVLRHFVRLRLTARLPLTAEATRRLLEIKDIAELYELWCYFAVERQLSALLGPPTEAEAPALTEYGAALPWAFRVAWPGVELLYNLSFSRSAKYRRDRSYSVPLRPDIVMRVRVGEAVVDHLFDAKFKVRQLPSPDAAADDEAADEAPEAPAAGPGLFKGEDLYKMHTYRDALPSARTVWILYPGTELRLFDTNDGVVTSVDALPAVASGVGALPLRPADGGDGLLAVLLRRLVGQG